MQIDPAHLSLRWYHHKMNRKFLAAVLGLLLLLACHHPAHVTGVTPGYTVMNDSVAQRDTAIEAILNPYKLHLDSIMDEVVGTTTVALPNEKGKLETLLGNFVSDVVLAKGNQHYAPADEKPAQVVVLNNGGLRASLPKGNITRRNVFELMPFDNEIVVVTLSGSRMWELIRYVAVSGGVPVAGMTLGMHPDKTPGEVLINGVPFDSAQTYKVMTSDYLAYGGDKMSFFKNPLKYETTGYLIRTAILDSFEEKHKAGIAVTPVLDGRIHYETK